jgi:molecular chaperone GrpE
MNEPKKENEHKTTHEQKKEDKSRKGSSHHNKKEIEQKLKAALKQAEESKAREEELADKVLRLRADFDNFRKRILKEKSELYNTANAELILELLPVLDHFELALNAAIDQKAHKSFCEGIKLIYGNLVSVLKKFGLTSIETEKKPFDPDTSEAVSYMPSDDVPEGFVISQTRSGYYLKTNLLRPAQVVVSSGKKEEESLNNDNFSKVKEEE